MILTERIVWKILKGDLDFLDSFSSNYIDELTKDIIDSPLREKILDEAFDLIYKKDPVLAFKISCSSPKFTNLWRRRLENNYDVLLDYDALLYFLLKVDWSKKFVFEIVDKLILSNKSCAFAILRYTERTNDYSLVKRIVMHHNLDVRGIFLEELIDTHAHMLFNVVDNITDCFVKYDKNGNVIGLMDEEKVSRIASLILIHNLGEDVYLQIRDFIFDNYDKNTLAANLDGYGKLNMDIFTLNKEMLVRDIDKLFVTSKNYKYALATRYQEYMDPIMLGEFRSKISPFTWIDREAVSKIFLSGLGDRFLECVDKYLEMSTGAKVIRDAGVGTCSRVFRVGDYVIKISHKKWSMEDNLCPRGYLFAKNYEEDIVRKSNGEVTGAIEVQRYLTRPLAVDDTKVINAYHEALREAGYYTKDVLTDGNTGANCYYLSSYMDADCDNPEELPEWFKENPVVMVDRDLVFKLENKNPKLKAINLK